MKIYQKQSPSQPKAKSRLHHWLLHCPLWEIPETLLKKDSDPEAKSITRHRLRRGLFHYHLQDGPKALLKTGSVIT